MLLRLRPDIAVVHGGFDLPVGNDALIAEHSPHRFRDTPLGKFPDYGEQRITSHFLRGHHSDTDSLAHLSNAQEPSIFLLHRSIRYLFVKELRACLRSNRKELAKALNEKPPL